MVGKEERLGRKVAWMAWGDGVCVLRDRDAKTGDSVDAVGKQSSLNSSQRVLSGAGAQPLNSSRTGRCNMRSEQDLWHRPQGTVAGNRLRIANIQSRSTQMPQLQCLDQRSRLDQVTSGRIDDQGSPLHRCDGGAIEQSTGLIVGGTMEGDGIGSFQ